MIKLKKLEIVHEAVIFDGLDRIKETVYNVEFRLTKALCQEIVKTANVTEFNMLSQAINEKKLADNEPELWALAGKVIDQYNAITHKNVKKSHNGRRSSALDKVYQTLKRGYNYRQILAVLEVKSKQYWFYKDGYHFFTIPTIFRPSNFDKYINEGGVLEILNHEVKE
jgi:hypothetical protein